MEQKRATAAEPPTQKKHRVVLKRTIARNKQNSVQYDDSKNTNIQIGELHLMLLGCEEQEPYGPGRYTGELFLDLVVRAMTWCRQKQESNDGDRDQGGSDTIRKKTDDGYRQADAVYKWKSGCGIISVSIAIYDCKSFDYPQTEEEWDSFDGIILAGSFSSALENEDWIVELRSVIRLEIHSKRRPTFAVCFGHQIFALALGNEEFSSSPSSSVEKSSDRSNTRMKGQMVARCLSGMQAGRKALMPNVACSHLLATSPAAFHPCHIAQVGKGSQSVPNEKKNDETYSACYRAVSGRVKEIHLLYTHQDVVAHIPPCAVTLCEGTSAVPVLAAAYFSSIDEATRFQQVLEELDEVETTRDDVDDQSSVVSCSKGCACQCRPVPLEPRPYALTFQSHPEFSGREGFERTFHNILAKFKEKAVLSTDVFREAKDDACCFRDAIEEDGLWLMIRVGKVLGWM